MNKREHLERVIDSGLEEMKKPFPEFKLWCDWSEKVLEIISRDMSPEVILKYLEVIYTSRDRTDKERMSMCLRYLIEIKELFI